MGTHSHRTNAGMEINARSSPSWTHNRTAVAPVRSVGDHDDAPMTYGTAGTYQQGIRAKT